MFKLFIKKLQYIILWYNLNHKIKITQKKYRKGNRIILYDRGYYQFVDKNLWCN